MTIFTLVLLLKLFESSDGRVCLNDVRLEKLPPSTHEREYVVPGYFYDRTLTEIFAEQEKSGDHEFRAKAGAHDAHPDDDHDLKNDESGTEGTGSYIVLALLLGIVVTIIITRLIPRFPSPLTTLSFGVLLAVIQKVGGTARPDGEHFMNLDSEYLIFGLTPVLILGEILKLDVRLAKRLVVQFLFYGLIGGVVNTVLAMFVLAEVLPPEYGTEIRLCLAALVSTADASFVGRILHGAGVSHRVILLIEGEGMSNDPGLFAVLTLGKVLYERHHITEAVAGAARTSVLEVIAMSSKIVIGGVALGCVIGILALGMINFTSNRFEEENRILQIVVTVIACYATFFLAEGVFEYSGALSVVCVGWILAWKMWPKVISEQAMTSFWHSIDFVAESLLYLICGFYIGYEAFDVKLGKCIGISFAIWGIALGCRFGTLFTFWPIINALGPKVNFRELFLWGWCSLKSRIGLALIIEFSLELLSEEHFRDAALSKRDIIFIIGCVFLISNVINGLTAGFVARILGLDRAMDFEEKLKSVLFKHSLFHVLRETEGLSVYLKHSFHFAVTNEEEHHKKKKHHNHEMKDVKPPSLTLDWSKRTAEEVVVAMRSVFLSVLRSLYWEENEVNKISIRAMQSLITAVDTSLEEIETKAIQDFYHLMVVLPSRESTHSEYRVIYTLASFIQYHAKAREIINKEVLGPLKAVDGEMPEVLVRSWEQVEKESQMSEEFARRELSLRFDKKVTDQFFVLRGLEVEKVEHLIEKSISRGLVPEKDSEESHEAFIEDMTSIKSTLRVIGASTSGPLVEENEKFLVDNTSSYDADDQTNTSE